MEMLENSKHVNSGYADALSESSPKISSKTLKILGFTSFPLVLATSLIVGSIFALAFNDSSFALILASALSELLVVACVLKFSKVGFGKYAGKILGIRKISPKFALTGMGIGLGLYAGWIVVVVLFSLLGCSLTGSDVSQDLDNTSRQSSAGLIAVLIFSSFVIPLIEEIFYRGYVFGFIAKGFHKKSQRVQARWAIGVSSVVFALAHVQGFSTLMDLITPLWILVFAVIAGVCRWRTGSILTSYCIHASYNFVIFLSMLISILGR